MLKRKEYEEIRIFPMELVPLEMPFPSFSNTYFLNNSSL
jgi:hypothetical protein